MPNIWLSAALIGITLLTSLLAAFKDLLPAFPREVMIGVASLSAIGAVLQTYRDVQGLKIRNSSVALAEGIQPIANAPKKQFTSKEETLYASLREDADRYRSAKIKLFFSPSISSESLYFLGLIAFNQRNLPEAEENLKIALRLDRNHTKAFNLLLQLYQSAAMTSLSRADVSTAEVYLTEAEQLMSELPAEPDLRTVTLVGYAYKSLGQVYAGRDPALSERYWDKAGETFEKVLAIEPNDANALNGFGNVLDHRGSYAEALAKHEAALQLAPNYTAAANDAAIVCEELMRQETDADAKASQKNRALEYWERAIALSKRDPQFQQDYEPRIRAHIEKVLRAP